MRVIFYTFIIITAVVLSLVILMPSLFDINSYKKKIQSIVYEKTGNTLEINGNINVSLFPVPLIKLEKIKYYKNKKDILFNSNQLVIVPEIISLLKGNIVFKSINLIKPSVFIKHYKDNSNNWSNSLKYNVRENIETKKDKKEIILNNENHKKFNPLNIKSFIMKDAKLTYEKNKKKYEFKNIKLSLEYLKDSNYIVDGHFDYNSEQMNFSYNISDKKPLLFLKGILKSSTMKLLNETQLSLDTLEGKSKVSINIERIHDLYKSEYLKNFPLDLKAEVIFNKKNYQFKQIDIISKSTNLNGKASYNEMKDKKIINLFMNANHLNLNDFIKDNTMAQKKTKNIKNSTNELKKEYKNKEDIDVFMLLEGYEIFLKIDLESIKYRKIIAKDVDFSLNKKDIISLKFLTDNLFNGKMESNIKFYKNKNMNLYFDANNIEIKEINNITDYNYILGSVDVTGNINGNLKNKNSFKKSISGDLLVKNKNTYLNNVNLERLKKNIKNIKKISSITKVKDGIFQGNTKIKNSKNTLIINKGVVKLPKTSLKSDQDEIIIKGNYNLANNKMNLIFNLNEDKNILLSLFKIKVVGDLNNISTQLDYDNKETEKVLNKILESQMKKIIKKKLDKKFNNVIENLLN